MGDPMRIEVEAYFGETGRWMPRGVRERVLAGVEEAAQRPRGRRRRGEWVGAAVALVLALCLPAALLATGRLPTGAHDEVAHRPASATGVAPATEVPPPPNGAAVAFDEARGQLVRFGGADPRTEASYPNDTWLWDVHTRRWTSARPATSPPARRSAIAVYDQARQDVVLFGGVDSGRSLADTWTWDGVTWSARAVTPPSGAPTSMVYDPLTRTVLLYSDPDPNRPGSLWSWDGSSWTALTSASPSTISGALVFDGRRIVLTTLMGGFVGKPASPSDETAMWEWNGTAWSSLQSLAQAPVFLIAAGFDPLSRHLVAEGVSLQTTWAWDGVLWSQLRPEHQPPTGLARSAVPNSLQSDPSTGRLLWYVSLDAAGTSQIWAWDGRDWTRLWRD